jgi:hypothetical protein
MLNCNDAFVYKQLETVSSGFGPFGLEDSRIFAPSIAIYKLD